MKTRCPSCGQIKIDPEAAEKAAATYAPGEIEKLKMHGEVVAAAITGVLNEHFDDWCDIYNRQFGSYDGFGWFMSACFIGVAVDCLLRNDGDRGKDLFMRMCAENYDQLVTLRNSNAKPN